MSSEKDLELFSKSEGMVYDQIDSPVGVLTMVGSNAGLHAILWDVQWAQKKYMSFLSDLKSAPDHLVIIQTKKQLEEYFQGKRKTFNLPLVISGTNFQKQVWHELLKIPYGQMISYGEQAARIGDANKARAVGAANGRNPISIVIPCHRVIGKKGGLTGFAGGLEKKAYLLDLEKKFKLQ
jgi:methylated-DNA-[protein]-cysteine S-methyltransferase